MSSKKIEELVQETESVLASVQDAANGLRNINLMRIHQLDSCVASLTSIAEQLAAITTASGGERCQHLNQTSDGTVAYCNDCGAQIAPKRSGAGEQDVGEVEQTALDEAIHDAVFRQFQKRGLNAYEMLTGPLTITLAVQGVVAEYAEQQASALAQARAECENAKRNGEQGVGEAPQLTEQQWRKFLSVAFRHCDLKGSIQFVELQQGLDAAFTPQQDTGGEE